MSLSSILLLLGLTLCICTERSLVNYAVYIWYDDSSYMRLGPLATLYALSHRIDPEKSHPTRFSGLYLNDKIEGKFPVNSCEMTVLLFKKNTKSEDLPVRYSELIAFLIDMIGSNDFDCLYGFEISRTEKNMTCKVLAAESVIDRLDRNIKEHIYFKESYNGATMMLAGKKPVSIKIVEKTGQDLWNLDIDCGQGFHRLDIGSTATVGQSIGQLILFPGFPFNGVRLYQNSLNKLSLDLPQIIFTVPMAYCNSFIDLPIKQRLEQGVFYEIQMNFCLSNIVGIEITDSEFEDEVVIKYFLVSSVTEKELEQIDYFIRRIPNADFILRNDYKPLNPCSPVIMRTSLTGPPMNLFHTPGAEHMFPAQYYEAGKLPKNIEKATFMFEFKNRSTVPNQTYAFVFSGPNDRFAKTTLLYTTFYNFVDQPFAVQDLLYRIVLRPTDGGKSMQYMWILGSLPEVGMTKTVTLVLKEFTSCLWIGLGRKPDNAELVMLRPTSLKIQGKTQSMFTANTVDSCVKNVVDDIEAMVKNMPFNTRFAQFSTPKDSATPDALPVLDLKAKMGMDAVSLNEYEDYSLQSKDPNQPPVIDQIIFPVPIEPVVYDEMKIGPSAVSPEIFCCLFNSEITSSRLILKLSGLQKQTPTLPSQIESSIKASGFAEFIGKATVYSDGVTEIIVSDSLNFIQLGQLKKCFISLFNVELKVIVRTKAELL